MCRRLDFHHELRLFRVIKTKHKEQGRSQILNLGWAREEHFLIFFLSLVLRAVGSPTREGLGYATAKELGEVYVVARCAVSCILQQTALSSATEQTNYDLNT